MFTKINICSIARVSLHVSPEKKRLEIEIDKGSSRIFKDWRAGRIGRDFALYPEEKEKKKEKNVT